MSLTKEQSNTLKVLASLLMLIDHIGIVIFPEQIAFRIIGRIALPLFVYQLVIGFKHTTDIKKYLVRLWIFALISQIPYTLLFETYSLNIFFTLLCALGLLYALREKAYSYIFPILVLSILFDMDYGIYLLLLALMFNYINNKVVLTTLFILINLITIKIGYQHPLQMFSILSLLIIYNINLLPKIKIINNKIFYWFYPIHLAVLLAYKCMS